MQISEQELNEFRLRRAALDQARALYAMVEEAYVAWNVRLMAQYGLQGRYTIDPADGIVREVPANG